MYILCVQYRYKVNVQTTARSDTSLLKTSSSFFFITIKNSTGLQSGVLLQFHFMVQPPDALVYYCSPKSRSGASDPRAGLCWLFLSPGPRLKVTWLLLYKGPSAPKLPARGSGACRISVISLKSDLGHMELESNHYTTYPLGEHRVALNLKPIYLFNHGQKCKSILITCRDVLFGSPAFC